MPSFNLLKTVFVPITAVVSSLFVGVSSAQVDEVPVVVTLSPETVRSIGGVSEFNRDQYITIHASPFEGDMTPFVQHYIEVELEASYGRDGGEQSGILEEVPADPKNSSFPDLDYLEFQGRLSRWTQPGHPQYQPEATREVVLCTHPEWMMGIPGNDFAAFGPTTPEAAAEFVAQYLLNFWTDETRPRYYEVFNEPFVHADDIGTTVEAMCEQHLITARRIRELGVDIMIGGYTAAWAEVEARNFEHWNNWQKKFMDLAGAEMDFFSTHFYDGINVRGTEAERTGSNTEAVIDLIDTYSHLSYGVAKPQIISEYGRIIQRDPNRTYPYSHERTNLLLRSYNGMLMTYMDHPDRLIKTVPFILGVGSWTYSFAPEEEPYDFLLFRKVGENFIPTDLELFYRFWKGIHGEWRHSASTDPDVRCQFIADDLQLNIALCNLDTEAREVSLQGLGEIDPARVWIRRLSTHEAMPTLHENVLPTLPESLTLEVGQSVMLIIDLPQTLVPDQTVTETRCYATDYLQAIEAETPCVFTFESVTTGDEGTAVLRMAIGRERGLNLQPTVTLDGVELEVPTDWAGGDQSGRGMFFGIIEVAVPIASLSETSTFEITFPDSGGKVASAVLQVNLLQTHD